MYRYWTGSAWTESITPDPLGTPAPSGAGAGAGTTGPALPYGSYRSSGTPGGAGGNQHPGQGAYSPGPTVGGGLPRTKRRATGWWITGGVALLALVVAIVLIVRGLGGSVSGVPDIGVNPTATASQNICPPQSSSSAAPSAGTSGDWISGGKLAYPALGSPWETQTDNRVPWGSLAMVQQVVDQENYDGKGGEWVASILVSDLYVGDGFASTKIAAQTVLTCVLGIYYSDTVVTQTPISSAQHNVDGHAGWLIETQLSFDITGLNAKGERVLLLVVQTGTDDYSLFYASIPDTRSDLLPDARTALASLVVR